MEIVLVAGEQSGDILGAGLIATLREVFPRVRFAGIGGARMQAQGLKSLAPLEALSIMGLVEPLKHLPELFAIRRRLSQYCLKHHPAVFIGIDAPDFNLGLEQRLRRAGVTTAHYVSPSVWAWRRWRLGKIARSVDLMLTLFPFEAAFYQQLDVPVSYVGHPLADEIPLVHDRLATRQALGLEQANWLAVMPGSRVTEIERLLPVFLETATWLRARLPTLQLIIPAATDNIYQRLRLLLNDYNATLPVTVINGRAREAMIAADAVLLASGTASLEALLLKRPLVVAYKTAPVTAWLARRLVKVPYFSLPNLLAGEPLVAEFFQAAATVENLGPAVMRALTDPLWRASLIARFEKIHRELRCDANKQAAAAVAALIKGDLS